MSSTFELYQDGVKLGVTFETSEAAERMAAQFANEIWRKKKRRVKITVVEAAAYKPKPKPKPKPKAKKEAA